MDPQNSKHKEQAIGLLSNGYSHPGNETPSEYIPFQPIINKRPRDESKVDRPAKRISVEIQTESSGFLIYSLPLMVPNLYRSIIQTEKTTEIDIRNGPKVSIPKIKVARALSLNGIAVIVTPIPGKKTRILKILKNGSVWHIDFDSPEGCVVLYKKSIIDILFNNKHYVLNIENKKIYQEYDTELLSHVRGQKMMTSGRLQVICLRHFKRFETDSPELPGITVGMMGKAARYAPNFKTTTTKQKVRASSPNKLRYFRNKR